MSETTVNVKAWSLSGDDFIISEQDGIKYFTMTQEKANRIASRMADLESQLAESQRREGLLRAVAEKAQWSAEYGGERCCPICFDWGNHASTCPYKAAIDGGALEGG